MEKGTVVHFDQEKGYGFIRSDHEPQDFYFHITKVKDRRELSKGVRVSFEIAVSAKGMQAEQIQPLDD